MRKAVMNDAICAVDALRVVISLITSSISPSVKSLFETTLPIASLIMVLLLLDWFIFSMNEKSRELTWLTHDFFILKMKGREQGICPRPQSISLSVTGRH
jgi:hypothetical protein